MDELRVIRARLAECIPNMSDWRGNETFQQNAYKDMARLLGMLEDPNFVRIEKAEWSELHAHLQQHVQQLRDIALITVDPAIAEDLEQEAKNLSALLNKLR